MGYDQNYDVGYQHGVEDRIAGKRRDTDPDATPGYDDGYVAGFGPIVVDMDAVACVLRRRGHDRCYVEQTGGGVATIYLGPDARDETESEGIATEVAADTRQLAIAGPGWFEGEHWTRARAWLTDFYIGPDDHGVSDPVVPWSADPDDIADIIELVAGAAPKPPILVAAKLAAAQRRFALAERDLAAALESAAVARIKAMWPHAHRVIVNGSPGDVDMIMYVDQITDVDDVVLYNGEYLSGPVDAHDSIEDIESDLLNWLATLGGDDWLGEQELDLGGA